MRQQWRWVGPSGYPKTCWYDTPPPIEGRMRIREYQETPQGEQHVEIRCVEEPMVSIKEVITALTLPPWFPCECDCHAAIAAGQSVFHAFPCCGYAG